MYHIIAMVEITAKFAAIRGKILAPTILVYPKTINETVTVIVTAAVAAATATAASAATNTATAATIIIPPPC